MEIRIIKSSNGTSVCYAVTENIIHWQFTKEQLVEEVVRLRKELTEKEAMLEAINIASKEKE